MNGLKCIILSWTFINTCKDTSITFQKPQQSQASLWKSCWVNKSYLRILYYSIRFNTDLCSSIKFKSFEKSCSLLFVVAYFAVSDHFESQSYLFMDLKWIDCVVIEIRWDFYFAFRDLLLIFLHWIRGLKDCTN